jgi:hypothetical protein
MPVTKDSKTNVSADAGVEVPSWAGMHWCQLASLRLVLSAQPLIGRSCIGEYHRHDRTPFSTSAPLPNAMTYAMYVQQPTHVPAFFRSSSVGLSCFHMNNAEATSSSPRELINVQGSLRRSVRHHNLPERERQSFLFPLSFPNCPLAIWVFA